MPAPDPCAPDGRDGQVRAWAPGRVNLIGEHTDYTGGFALPMAIQLGTRVVYQPTQGAEVRLRSDSEEQPAVVPLPRAGDAAPDPRQGPAAGTWARWVAAVVEVVTPPSGGCGRVSSTLPIGAGLSSSAALEVALALALGFTGTPLELAQACQRAEHAASGVPSGIMDQLTVAAGVAGNALLMDCRSLETTPVPVPEGVEAVAVHSGQRRALAGSAYAERRAQCEAAERIVGPLRDAAPATVEGIGDPLLRRRSRHVVTENARVLAAVEALRAGEVAEVGTLMDASHRSLADDFQVSTPALDDLATWLRARPGVHGARLTGAGFGGCVVALAESAAVPSWLAEVDRPAWRLRPSAGAGVGPLPPQEAGCGQAGTAQ